MKFSICLPTGFEGVMYPVPFVDPSDFVRMAKLCEKLGYHSVWGNDHIQSQALCARALSRHAAQLLRTADGAVVCAAATTTLEVGTALAVQPMRDPFWLAKTAATIDQLSNGRLILALGIGAYREEFAAWGATHRRQGATRRDDGRRARADAAPVQGAPRHP